MSLALPKEDLEKGTTWTRQIKIPAPLRHDGARQDLQLQGPDEQAGGDVERIGLETKID